jgi:hypothetical protein
MFGREMCQAYSERELEADFEQEVGDQCVIV